MRLQSPKNTGGGGLGKDSPDETAFARIMTNEYIKNENAAIWVEIIVEDYENGNKQILKFIDRGISSKFHARNHSTVEWAEDSQSVNIEINGKEFVIER